MVVLIKLVSVILSVLNPQNRLNFWGKLDYFQLSQKSLTYLHGYSDVLTIEMDNQVMVAIEFYLNRHLIAASTCFIFIFCYYLFKMAKKVFLIVNIFTTYHAGPNVNLPLSESNLDDDDDETLDAAAAAATDDFKFSESISLFFFLINNCFFLNKNFFSFALNK